MNQSNQAAQSAYEQTTAILREAGYECRREIGTQVRGLVSHDKRLEFWIGPKGVIILQLWKENNGCHLYANWPLGSTFDDLRNALTAPKRVWQPMETAPKDRPILARQPGYEFPIIVKWRERGEGEISKWAPNWYDGDAYYPDLTEWQDLPA